MNKNDTYETLLTIKNKVELGGSTTKGIPELLSLAERGYIELELVSVRSSSGNYKRATNIYIANAGHDFLSYAKELNSKGIDISNLSYEDIEHYGRTSLLKSLGLEDEQTQIKLEDK